MELSSCRPIISEVTSLAQHQPERYETSWCLASRVCSSCGGKGIIASCFPRLVLWRCFVVVSCDQFQIECLLNYLWEKTRYLDWILNGYWRSFLPLKCVNLYKLFNKHGACLITWDVNVSGPLTRNVFRVEVIEGHGGPHSVVISIYPAKQLIVNAFPPNANVNTSAGIIADLCTSFVGNVGRMHKQCGVPIRWDLLCRAGFMKIIISMCGWYINLLIAVPWDVTHIELFLLMVHACYDLTRCHAACM